MSRERLKERVRELKEVVEPELEDEIGLYLDMAKKAENEKCDKTTPYWQPFLSYQIITGGSIGTGWPGYATLGRMG